MEIITLPVPDKLLEISNDTDVALALKDYVVDISSIKYDDPDLENNKIECSLIYFRNIDLPLACDFSKLSYEDREAWLLNYINSDLFDLHIKELLETLLNVLVDEPIDGIMNIFNEEETLKFREDHKELIDELIQFIVSSNIIISYALTRIDDDTPLTVEDLDLDLPIIKGKPLFYETMLTLLSSYPIHFDAINLYYADKAEQVAYEYLIQAIEKNSAFYLAYLNLPSAKFLDMVLNENVEESKHD